eukprot:scaffold19181_cov129-Isochrysis_galbana.AAC.1
MARPHRPSDSAAPSMKAVQPCACRAEAMRSRSTERDEAISRARGSRRDPESSSRSRSSSARSQRAHVTDEPQSSMLVFTGDIKRRDPTLTACSQKR